MFITSSTRAKSRRGSGDAVTASGIGRSIKGHQIRPGAPVRERRDVHTDTAPRLPTTAAGPHFPQEAGVAGLQWRSSFPVEPSDLPVGGTESVLTDSRSVFTTSPSSRYAATRNLVTLPRGRLSSRIPTSAAVPHPFTDPSPCRALRSPLGQIRRANIASEKRHLKLRDQGHHHRQHVFTRKQTCGMESNPGNLCFPRAKSWVCHGDGTQKPTPPKPGTRKMGEGSFSHGVIERLIQKDATHATCWASS